MKFKEGRAYYIKAYDHSVGMQDEMIVETVGWVVKQNDISVTLTYWTLEIEKDSIRETNVEPYVILKGAIIKRIELKDLPTRKYDPEKLE